MHKTYLKMIKDLNLSSDILNLIEEKVGTSLKLIGTIKDSLNRRQIVWSLRTINKWDLMKPKASVHQRAASFGQTLRATEWENTFTNYIFNRRIISSIYKELKKTGHQENR